MSLNPWREFLGNLPAPALLVLEVEAHHADGTSSVVLPGGGGTLRVRGTSVAVGDFAFVRDGVVEGEAPPVTPGMLSV